MVVMPVDLPLLTITVQCWQTSSESAHGVVCLCLCMAWCTLSSLVGAYLLLCHGKHYGTGLPPNCLFLVVSEPLIFRSVEGQGMLLCEDRIGAPN